MNWIKSGTLIAGLAVALGAFGAHGLQGRIEPELLEIFKTSTQYLMIHSLGLILYGVAGFKKSWPAACFLFGMFFFSGSLYGILATGIRTLGAITPIGGILFMAGWIGFALQAKKGVQR